jgi:hypothetical protein
MEYPYGMLDHSAHPRRDLTHVLTPFSRFPWPRSA